MHWVCNVSLHCFGRSDCHQLGKFCMMIAIRENTTFSTSKFPNPYTASLAHGCCGTVSRKHGRVGPICVKTLSKGSELHGHEGKRMGRHCTSTGRGAAQSEGSALHKVCHIHKMKGFAEIGRCAGHRPRQYTGKCSRRSHGHFHAMQALKTSKPCNARRW